MREESLQGMVRSSVRQSLKQGNSCWCLLADQAEMRDAGRKKNLGKARTSSMMNWGCSFTRGLGKFGERPP